MSTLALFQVIAAACIHAGWNLLAKRAAGAGASFVFAYSLFGSLIYLPWVIWALGREHAVFSAAVLGCVVASGAIHLGYSLALQRGYRVADLSVVYPVARGTGPLLSTVGAIVLLREGTSAAGLAGMLSVVVGILLIATSGRLARFRAPGAWTGIRWGVSIGMLIAAYTVVDAYVVKVLLLSPVVLEWFSNLVRLTAMTPMALRHPARVRDAMRGHWHLALAVGVLSPMAYVLVLFALQSGAPLSLVAPAREMSMMVAAVLGILLLREKIDLARLAGCAIIVMGVVLLGRS